MRSTRAQKGGCGRCHFAVRRPSYKCRVELWCHRDEQVVDASKCVCNDTWSTARFVVSAERCDAFLIFPELDLAVRRPFVKKSVPSVEPGLLLAPTFNFVNSALDSGLR